MYFIARNNKFYNYIAHTQPAHRYFFTGGLVICMVLTAGYFLHYTMNAYSIFLLREYGILQQKNNDLKLLEQKNTKLASAIDETKKDIAGMAISDNSNEFFKKQLIFVLETAQQSGLKINSYGTQKEKDAQWYKKETAHLDVSGSLQQLMTFLALIKNSQKMISSSRWSLLFVNENIFQLHCDIGFIFVHDTKKIPSSFAKASEDAVNFSMNTSHA